MSAVEIAALRIEVDATPAAAAKVSLDDLVKSGVALEQQAPKIGRAVTDSLTKQSKATSDFADLEQKLLERNGAFRASQIIKAAQDADRAAAGRIKAEQEAADVERTLMARNAGLRAALIVQEVKAEQDASAQRARIAEQEADQERILLERNAAFRTSLLIKQVKDAEAAASAEAAAVQRAAEEVERARKVQADIEATLLERNATLRAGLVVKQAQDEERAATVTAGYAAKVGGLRAELDPLAAVQATLAQRTRLLDEAMAHGAITQDQHAATLSQVTRAALADVQAIDRLNKSHKDAAGSAKLQSYELLNLTRQANDVVVSLAGGQNPLLVLIQQGSQIGDVFSEAATRGVTFKAAITSLIEAAAPIVDMALPFLGVAAAIAIAGKAAIDGEKNLDDFSRAVAISGNYAGLTGDQYEAMAIRVGQATQSGFGTARKTLLELVESGKFTGDTVESLSVDIIKLSEFTGKSSDEIAKRFIGMKGSVKDFAQEFHDDYHGLLSPAIVKHIGDLEDQGKRTEAVNALSVALYDDMAKKGQASLGWLKGWWSQVRNEIDLATQALQGFTNKQAGGAAVNAINIADLKRQIATDKSILNGPLSGLANRSAIQAEIDQKQRQIDAALAATKVKSVDNSKANNESGATAAEDLELKLRRQIADAKKTDAARRLDLAGDAVKNEAQAKGISGDTLANLVKLGRDAEQQRINKDAAAAGRRADAAATRGLRNDGFVSDAAATADKAYLAAEAALTSNILKLADQKKDQIDQEATATKAKLENDAKVKHIDLKRIAAIEQTIDDTTKLKKQKVDDDTDAQLEAQRLQQKATINGYYDQISKINAALAPTLESRNKIEEDALAARQKVEAETKASQLAQQVHDGKITQSYADGENAALGDRQRAEKREKLADDAVAIQQRDLAVAQAASQNEADILASRGALTYSVAEQVKIEERIRQLRYQDAVRADQAVIDRFKLGKATKDQADIAEDHIKTLTEINANDKEIAERQHALLNAYSQAIDAFAGMAKSIIDGDVGGTISGLSNTLGKLAGVTSGGLSQALGSAASVLGPLGQAVSAVSSVLGAFNQASAQKAQAKLDAFKQSVDDLKTANMASSGSIADALSKANANWNSDLEYTSAMVTSLRSIDSQIGSLANAVSKSIATGNLLSTSGLGLGASGSSAGSIFGLVGGLLFGNSKSKTELLDQGLTFNPTTYGALSNGGITGSTYADLATTKTKSFLGFDYSTKVTNSTVTGAVDPALLTQISGVIEALGKGVVTAASTFGQDAADAATKALANAQIDIGKLSLKGLSSDEIEKLLNATFDKVADQLAAAGVPSLDALADAGEGAFATLTRLAREYEVVDVSLKSIGKEFGSVGIASLAARDGLVKMFGSLDDFVSETSFFASNFLSADEQLAITKKSVAEGLAKLGVATDLTRDQFKDLVLAQDLTTSAGQAMYAALLGIAPAFDKVANAAADTAKTIASAAAQMVSDAESRVSTAKSALQDAYDAEKTRLQGIVDAATAAATAVDTATSALKSAYDTQASSIQSTIDKLTSFSQSVKDFSQTLTTGDLSGASASQKTALTGAEFQRVLAAAKGGDETAQGQYQNAAQAYLDAAKASSSSQFGYISVLNQVLDANDQLGKTADGQVSLAQQQLTTLKTQVGALIDLSGDVKSVDQAIGDLLTARQASAAASDAAKTANDQLLALDAQVAGLIEVNKSVLSVKDAVTGLNAAIVALANAKTVQANGTGWTSPSGGVAVPTNPGYSNPYGDNGALLGVSGLQGKNAAGQATFDGFTAAELAWVNSPLELGGEKTAAAQAIQQLKAMYGPNVLPGFAKGGSFMIGGYGGIDQNLLSINGQPAAMVGQGEIVTVTPPGAPANDNGWGAVINELRGLRQSNAELKAELAALRQDGRIGATATVKAINRQTETIEKWDEEGTPPVRA